VEGDDFDGLRTVIDHEDLERPALQQGKQSPVDQRLAELLPRDRLLHDRRRAEREARAGIGLNRDDDQRDAPQLVDLLEVQVVIRPLITFPPSASRVNDRRSSNVGTRRGKTEANGATQEESLLARNRQTVAQLE
jgi:hypothetical protein